MVANRLDAASVGRRLAALVIDLVVVGVPFIGGSLAFGWLYLRLRGSDDELLDDEPIPAWLRSRRAQLILSSVSVSYEIASRNRRAAGYRALGLRRVDARTGGPVSARSAVIRSTFTHAWTRFARGLTGRDEQLDSEQRAAVRAEAEEARRRHPDDPDAATRAAAEVYRRHGVVRARSCASLVASALLLYVPAIWSPLNQTLPDRLAGIVVVRE